MRCSATGMVDSPDLQPENPNPFPSLPATLFGSNQGCQGCLGRGSNKGWVSVEKRSGELNKHRLSPCKIKWNVDIQSPLSLL